MKRAKGPGQSVLLLLDVIDVLNKFHVPYAIIGAFAASFYGVVRASLDADAIISLQQSQMDAKMLSDKLQKIGLKITYRKGDLKDPIGAVINAEDNFGNRVDLLMNIRGMTEDSLLRAIKTAFMGTQIRLIGIEDFIAMKIFAGSPTDLSDVDGVLRVSHGRINLSLLKELAQNYGKGVLSKLESLLLPQEYRTRLHRG